jgi:hypothetical protein
MTSLGFGTNTAVFLIFFGLALLDALTSGNWLRSAFWIVVGLLFLRADALKPRKSPPED